MTRRVVFISPFTGALIPIDKVNLIDVQRHVTLRFTVIALLDNGAEVPVHLDAGWQEAAELIADLAVIIAGDQYDAHAADLRRAAKEAVIRGWKARGWTEPDDDPDPDEAPEPDPTLLDTLGDLDTTDDDGDGLPDTDAYDAGPGFA